jgi:hypothetical protein
MTQTIFEPEAIPLATRPARELAPAPVNLQTMAGLLTIAVEKGLSPEAMERLVALQQRLMQQQAEEAFNLAIQRFQSACPVLTTADTDDDGRGITTPSPQPGPDPNSPRVATRDQRQQADAGPPRVTAETLNRLLMKWKDKVSKQGTPAGFADWCSEKLSSDADLLKPSNWKIEMVEAIEELLR